MCRATEVRCEKLSGALTSKGSDVAAAVVHSHELPWAALAALTCLANASHMNYIPDFL